MKKNLIIDGNNLAFRVWFALEHSAEGHLKTSSGVPTTIIYGILNALNAFTRDNTEVNGTVIVWDCGGSKYKKKVEPIYKANRDHSEHKDLFAEINLAQSYLQAMGLFSFFVYGIEADEVIGYLTQYFKDQGDKSIVFSDDSDMYQLKKHNISIWRPVMNRYVKNKDVIEKFRCMPKYVPYVLAVTGSKKDNIPGVCDIVDGEIKASGLGVAYASKFLQPVFEGNEVFNEYIRGVQLTGRFQEQLHRNRQQILRSYKLANIRRRNVEFTNKEIKQLLEKIKEYNQFVQNTCSLGAGKLQYKVKQIAKLLEIQKINVVKVIKRLGVINEKKDGR